MSQSGRVSSQRRERSKEGSAHRKQALQIRTPLAASSYEVCFRWKLGQSWNGTSEGRIALPWIELVLHFWLTAGNAVQLFPWEEPLTESFFFFFLELLIIILSPNTGYWGWRKKKKSPIISRSFFLLKRVKPSDALGVWVSFLHWGNLVIR